MELIVSIAIFSLVLLGAIGVMVNVFGAQRKAIAIKEVLDNSRFPIELMSRELRTPTHIQGIRPSGCPTSGLQFTSHNGSIAQERFYYLRGSDGTIMRVAMTIADSIDCALAQELTAKEVLVDNVSTVVFGDGLGPNDGQPRITFGFRVQSRDPRFAADTMINVQTTVTQRLRDN